MKTLTIILIYILSFSFTSYKDFDTQYRTSKKNADLQKLDSCYFNNKKLYGKIRLVEDIYDADIKVQIVNSFPDLKVQFVENFADQCGEWQIVEFGEDLKVYFTESFPDIKIQPVANYPGLP